MHYHNEFMEAIRNIFFIITLPITCIFHLLSGFFVVGMLLIFLFIALLTGNPMAD
jgi:hypothetical protein